MTDFSPIKYMNALLYEAHCLDVCLDLKNESIITVIHQQSADRLIYIGYSQRYIG